MMKRIVLVVAAVAGFALGGCCKPGDQSGWCKAEQLAVDCGEPALQQEIFNLVPAVEAILNSNSPNWQQQLAGLESAGMAVLTCAVKKVVGGLMTKAEASSPPDPNAPKRLARGQAYLAKKKVK